MKSYGQLLVPFLKKKKLKLKLSALKANKQTNKAYVQLCWIFDAMRAFFQLWQARATLCCSAQASYCSSFPHRRAQSLSTWASVVVGCGLTSFGTRAQLICSLWNLPGRGIETMSLLWQMDSYPLCHQGSPLCFFCVKMSILLSLLCRVNKSCYDTNSLFFLR